MVGKCRLATTTTMIIYLFASPASGSSQEIPSEMAALRHEITSFLTTWLVKKETDSSLSFFSQQAFHNPALLSSDCVGLISRGQVWTPDDRRQAVSLFLEDFNEELTVESLQDLLSIKRLELSPEQVIGAINNWKSDRFLIGKLERDDIPEYMFNSSYDEQAIQFMLGEREVGPLYWNIVFLENGDLEGGLLLIWKHQGNQWKVVHIDLVCQ